MFVTQPGKRCRIGVLDLDAHEPDCRDRLLQALQLQEVLGECGYTSYHVTSRHGRGAHVWMFFDPPGVMAADLHARLLLWADELRTDGPVDVFPNSATGDGGAVFLPYFGSGNELRDVDCKPVPWDKLEANPPEFIPATVQVDWPPKQWRLHRSSRTANGEQFQQVLDEGARAGLVFFRGDVPQARRGYRNKIAGAVAKRIARDGGSVADFETWDAGNEPPLASDEPRQLRQWWRWATRELGTR